MSPAHTALITGGAGFIGTNLADRLMSQGMDVIIFDDLSRGGAQDNMDWLFDRHARQLSVTVADIRDIDALRVVVANASEVYHLAAQVAVTTSLDDPRQDFAINAAGTLNLLEALRALDDPPPLLYTSTNKVYGDLADIALTSDAQRYVPMDEQIRANGISEHRPLDFHSPYGCSKGAADQYVRDYARCYGLRNVVFRMSCIYGPHQHGNEDQGWVAHFMMRARSGKPLTIYGDGLQVRDVLFVEDLIDAFQLAMRASDQLAGHTFNMGGGPGNTLSLRELLTQLEERAPLQIEHSQVRRGDQRYYVSDTSAFQAATGWQPRTSVPEGLAQLSEWLDRDEAAHSSATEQPVAARSANAVPFRDVRRAT
jgi:CDP-paratose 2-epimerase